MLSMEDKENEPQQEKANKLAVEPPVNQKPRRSVLKEFDPFAPDSPCPPRLNNSEKIDEEEDIFEDAETSLRKFNILLVPDLRINQQEAKNPNCLSYVEAAESLSEVEGLASFDKTSSEEDVEFNAKKHNGNSDTLVDNSDSNLLNISSDMDGTSGLNDGNIMVDSLERIFEVSNRLNSFTENMESPIIPSKTKPIDAQETPINVARNISELSYNVESRVKVELAQMKENKLDELGTMIDSLELPDLQKNTPISDSTFGKNQYTLIDSLEIVKAEEGLNIDETMEKSLSTIAKPSHDILANQLETDQINTASGNVVLNITFESLSSDIAESKTDQFQSNQIDASNGNVELNKSIVEVVEYKTDQLQHDQINTSCVNVELNQTIEYPSSKNVFSKIEVLQSDVPSVNMESNETFESPSSNNLECKTDHVQSDEISTSIVNVEFSQTFHALSSDVQSNTDRLQSDQLNTSNNILESNETFDGTSLDNVQSKTAQFQSDQINTSSVNLEANQTFDGISLDNVECKTDQFQSDQINTSSVNLEANQTFDGISLDNVECKTDQFQCHQTNTSNVNVEFNKTFETPLSNNVESKTDQRQNDKVTTADDKILTKTVDSHENVQCTKQNSTQIIDSLNETEENLQQNESNTKKEEDCDTEIAAVNKTLETLSNSTVTLIAENQNNQGVCIDTEILGNIVEQTVESCKREAITPIVSQSTTNDTHNVQDRSVSLKDIDIDSTSKDDIGHDNIEEISSHRHSLPPDSSEHSNSTFITEEQAAESRRVLDALAQSLNQTIDVEESAIVDDINSSKSTNTSGELTQEKLNVTIENVTESLTEHEYVIGGKEDIKSEENVERTSIKTLERKATEEFEDLEREFNEKTKNTASCTEPELGEKTICSIEEQCSKAFHRQDTREFEVLEREYCENAKNINDCNSITGNNSEEHIKNNEAKDENVEDEEIIKDDKKSKLINIQDTQEFEDLKSDCTAKFQTSKEYSDDLKLSGEKTVEHLDAAGVKETDNKNANTSIPGAKESINGDDLAQAESCIGHVKVKVSGNICNANSVSSELKNIESKTTHEEPYTGINLKKKVNVKDDLNLDFEDKSLNNIAQNSTDVTVNHNVPTSTKTDSDVAKEVLNSTNDENVLMPKVNESIVKPKYKPECRPSTRSLRNQIQVIDKSVVLNNDTSSGIKQEKNDQSDEQLQKYESKSEDLMKQVHKLKTEINTVKEKNKQMDKFILTCALDTETERDKVIKWKKVVEEYEFTLASQNEELERLKTEEEKSTKSFTSLEMAFADIFEKYEKAKSVIGLYKKNEEILQRNIQCAEDQLSQLEAKCSVTKEQYSKKLKTVQEEMDEEKEKYKQSIAKLQAHIKRLEIKSSCLETSLRQKTDECRALAALCDDITGKPM